MTIPFATGCSQPIYMPPTDIYEWEAAVERFVAAFAAINSAVNWSLVEWAHPQPALGDPQAPLATKLRVLRTRQYKVAMPPSYREAIGSNLTQAESMVGYLAFIGESPFALMAHPEFWSAHDGPGTLAPGRADVEKLNRMTSVVEQIACQLGPLMVLVRLYQVDGIERTIASPTHPSGGSNPPVTQ